MVLPSSGSISVSQIDAEFGLTNSSTRISNDLGIWINLTAGGAVSMSQFLGRSNLSVDGLGHQFGSAGNVSGMGAVYYYTYGVTDATIRVVINGTNPTSYFSLYIYNGTFNTPNIYVHLTQNFTGTVALQSQPGNTTGGTWVTRTTLSVTNVSSFYIAATI